MDSIGVEDGGLTADALLAAVGELMERPLTPLSDGELVRLLLAVEHAARAVAVIQHRLTMTVDAARSQRMWCAEVDCGGGVRDRRAVECARLAELVGDFDAVNGPADPMALAEKISRFTRRGSGAERSENE
ncbi:hypothetical protein [Nocardia macrotermitis]|uniref:Uncharacterized protein n=1 Tax=Nocardia macrotermitis TaxID=2585198 RepID=A0A7K0D0Y2_9NOCA|nr:hypothetical protein [Nocardia macrotermitis]MQY18882.1 hypothetical protein [Nocardia macrotermitis]